MDKKTAIITAAEWWANKVMRRQRHDNGAKDPENRMAMHLADLLARPANAGQGAVFLKELTAGITEAMLQRDWLNLEVDYGPCPILAEAARVAGVNVLAFPFKHAMQICPAAEAGEYIVSVQEGYGAAWRELEPVGTENA